MVELSWLRGKVALVTGAAGGLGLGLSRVLAANGARVIMADVDAAGVQDASAALNESGGATLAFHLDVTDGESWNGVARQTREAFGEVDFLCNNAGIVGAYEMPLGVSPDVLRQVLDTNVVGALRGVQTFAPAMRERQRGHILNIGSMTGIDTVSAASDYSASKHALVSLCEAMRDELSPDGIIVSLLCPGAVDTGLGGKRIIDAASGSAPGAPPASSAAARPSNAMPVLDVAAIALAGLTRGDFFIFTHAEGRQRLQKRVDEMLLGFDTLDAVMQ
ncbi:SDR family NAD(P)-dependent oxidoreductase [Sphingopyxis sp.]|uniref:SDR family NAD(P)-dependent oxidoreductase n=1 Tax=Sphingopyxis sp. TaxID=1908224 RepID=UPI003D6CAD05